MERAIAMLTMLMLGACVTDVAGWSRTDRRALDYRRLLVDQAICRGEMDRSALIIERERRGVYEGCMAGRGYLPIRPQ